MLCYFFIVDFSFKKVISSLCEGDMGVYGIALFFSSGISVILILLMCGIAVSSSPTECIFLSFWLTVFSKRRSLMVLLYHSFAFSCLMQVNIWKTLL